MITGLKSTTATDCSMRMDNGEMLWRPLNNPRR